MQGDDPSRSDAGRWTISSAGSSSRYGDLQHAPIGSGGYPCDLIDQLLALGRLNAQTRAATKQTFEVSIQKPHATVDQQCGLEQPVAVVQAAIVDSNRLRRIRRCNAVDEQREGHVMIASAAEIPCEPRARSTPRALARVS